MPKAETAKAKAERKKVDREASIQLLKTHLQISPKTANMLYDSGYTSPPALRNATPNQVVAKFGKLPDVGPGKAKAWYLRPLRRMVMLGDIDDTEEAIAAAKVCQKWSIKHLESLGIWEEGFDDLTGKEIREKLSGMYPKR